MDDINHHTNDDITNPQLVVVIKCHCGRNKNKRHCPSCGRAKTYAYKNKTERLHPETGIYIEVTVFRCEACGRNFDDLDWRYTCQAPILTTSLKKEKEEITAKLMLDRAMANEKFGENDKRSFKRLTKLNYDQFMSTFKQLDEKRIKHALDKFDEDSSVIKTQAKAETMEEQRKEAQTPYSTHIENCSVCQASLDDTDMCEEGRKLK